MHDGDRIFLFTDGLTDIITDDFKQIDPGIFADIFRNRELPVSVLFDELIKKVNSPEFIKADDCTVMIIEKKMPGG